jgi:hypothetical protein
MGTPIPLTNPPAYHGKDGRILLSEGASGVDAALKVVALIAEWTLDMTRDKVETTALGSPNKTYVAGLKDIKGTISGFWNDKDDALFVAADAADGVYMALYPVDGGDWYWTGPAWIDASIKGGTTSAVTFDGTFTANGAWVRMPATIP